MLVLCLDFGYDGISIIGCYSSQELAKEAAFKYMCSNDVANDFDVYNIPVDTEPLFGYYEGESFTLTPSDVVEYYK